MSSDRIVLVGIIWTLLLLGLLVLRELLKASGRARGRWVLPTLDVLVVVMVCAAALTGGLRLASILGPSVTTAGASPSPVPASASPVPGSPSPVAASPSPVAASASPVPGSPSPVAASASPSSNRGRDPDAGADRGADAGHRIPRAAREVHHVPGLG